MANITKRFVSSLKPDGKTRFHWDDALSGFGVRVSPQGTVAYVVQYRNQQRENRRMTIGRHYGKTNGNETSKGSLDTPQARKIAEERLRDVKAGLDPSAQRKATATAPTLDDLMQRYITDYAEVRKRPASVETDKINIRQQIFANIRKTKKVADVNREDIERMKKALATQRPSFNRARAVLSKAMELAEAWEYRPQNSNPCRYVEKYKLETRERYLTFEEFGRLGEALSEVERQQTASPYAVAAIRLLLFLGARRGEVLGLKWEDVNLEHGIIYLPTSKTGKKPLYLNPPAMEILANIPHKDDNSYVICGEKPGQPIYDMKGVWRRIRKASGLEDVRIHDLRHSYASVGAIGGVPLQTLGRLLGHASTETTERYAHLADDPVRAANDAIGQRIADALRPQTQTADVIPLSKT